MRTLVTGGAGYIGKELVDELLDAGREVTVLDVLLHGQRVDDLTQARREVRRGRHPRSGRPPGRSGGRRGGRAPGGDRRRSRVRARSRARAGGQRRRQLRARRGGRRRALRDGQHLLQLRADGRSDDADRRDRHARAGQPLRRAEGHDRAAPAQEQAGGRLPALRHRLRGRTADALRPDGQRVHPRPVGRQAARGLRRAVLAPVRARPRCRARHPHHPRGARGQRVAARCSTSATRARTTASSISSRRSRSRPTVAP